MDEGEREDKCNANEQFSSGERGLPSMPQPSKSQKEELRAGESGYSPSAISLWKDNVKIMLNEMNVTFLVSHHTFLDQQMTVAAVLVWLGPTGQGLLISCAELSTFPVFDLTSQ